jgi:imidazolonepropionase-like amidohydrolase
MDRLLAVLLLALLPALARGESAPIVIRHVTVIDATGAAAQPDRTIVISRGRIAQVGKTGEIAVPPDAHVVDAADKFLIPGLWDMHVHWYDEASLPVFLANGVTGMRIMCGYPLHLAWRRKADEGKLFGPRLVIAGPIVDGAEPVWPDSIRAESSAEGSIAVASTKRHGYDCAKVYNLLPPDAYFGAAQEARRLGFPLVGHVPYGVNAGDASDAGQKSIEHLNGVSLACSRREAESRRLLLAAVHNHLEPATGVQLRFEIEAEDSYDQTRAAALFIRFVRNGTWHVPTLVVRQAHSALPTASATDNPRLRYLPASMKSRWDNRRAATLRKLGPEDFANFKRSLRKHLELTGAMHRAGVRLMAGTDTGALDCFPGFSLHDELQLLVKAGLTPMEALQTATRNPAQFLDRSSDLGTVERGKLAELLLLDANPLDDIRNTTKIHAVIVNGRLLLQDKLEKALADVEAHCQKPGADQPPGVHDRYP